MLEGEMKDFDMTIDSEPNRFELTVYVTIWNAKGYTVDMTGYCHIEQPSDALDIVRSLLEAGTLTVKTHPRASIVEASKQLCWSEMQAGMR